MLDYRLDYLIAVSQFHERVAISEAIKRTGLSEVSFFQELNVMNDVLFSNNKSIIQYDKKEIFFPKNLHDNWLAIELKKIRSKTYSSIEERVAFIYMAIFLEGEDLTIYHLQEMLSISRSTVVNDLNRLRTILKKLDIYIKFSKSYGYVLLGKEEKIRLIAREMSLKLLKSSHTKLGFLYLIKKADFYMYAKVCTSFKEVLRVYSVETVPGRLEETEYFLSAILIRMKKSSIKLDNEEYIFLINLKTFKIAKNFYLRFFEQSIDSKEIAYLTIILISTLQGGQYEPSLVFLLSISDQIINEIERLAAIKFADHETLLFKLYRHLVPAYFRIKYNMSSSNIIISEIKKNYRELFQLTKYSLKSLEQNLAKEVPEDEIGYFTIIFGGEIEKQKNREKADRYRALILCPNGTSASLILRSELIHIFPTITFKETVSVAQFKELNMELSFDMIFSTIDLPTISDKTVFIVNPIMDKNEKRELVNRVRQKFAIPSMMVPSAKEIITLIEPYINLKPDVSMKKIQNILEKNLFTREGLDQRRKPMLSELLTMDTVQFSDKKLSWQEAITLAAEPLLKNKQIEERYVQAMIAKVNEYGAFINIGPGIALPHARPDEGVLKLGMSMLKVTEPVLLLDLPDHPIDTFICLAAIDNEMHLKALSSLTTILSEPESLEVLRTAKTKEKIMEIIREGEK
ncbi:MAG: PTS sugar transporter subunit IIA [Tetragenococcus halophilus]|nr:PTS sugar transporter subunit IIA [Tetragenococcus sp.]MDN6839628.1 PTS sugar transporter subunit IIA [Tetragenococcus halophilus]